MTKEQAIAELKDLQEYSKDTFITSKPYEDALDIAIEAVELLGHIKDRPCTACEFKVNGDCTKWDCVFDAWLNAYGSRRDIVGKEQQND